jgi:hypothetical protein
MIFPLRYRMPRSYRPAEISSLVAALKMKRERYTAMPRFFRPVAFTVETLYHKLIRPVMARAPVTEINGRNVMRYFFAKISCCAAPSMARGI